MSREASGRELGRLWSYIVVVNRKPKVVCNGPERGSCRSCDVVSRKPQVVCNSPERGSCRSSDVVVSRKGQVVNCTYEPAIKNIVMASIAFDVKITEAFGYFYSYEKALQEIQSFQRETGTYFCQAWSHIKESEHTGLYYKSSYPLL